MRHLRFRFFLLSMIISAVLSIVQPGPANADMSPPTLTPGEGPPGTHVTATASDWVGCTSMGVSGWGHQLATTSINGSGAFSLPFTVPSDAPVGTAQLQFAPTCTHSAIMPFVGFTVTRDTSNPSVSWTSPVSDGKRLDVSSGRVSLAATASDNVGVARVQFLRWDASGGKWVNIAVLGSPPWATKIDVGSLNGQWNQVNVRAWDAAGNVSPSPHIWLYRLTPPSFRLQVPFATQLGSAGDPNSGSNNCGPASITMSVLYGGGTTTVPEAAIAIRGSNTTKNGPTNFKLEPTKAFLAKFSLIERNVTTFDQLRAEISAKRPVVILINNFKYRDLNPPPYENNNPGWFTTAHIIVVTGYDSANVYVNDPLRRSGPDYAIPVSVFKDAASTAPGTSATNWYAVSVGR